METQASEPVLRAVQVGARGIELGECRAHPRLRRGSVDRQLGQLRGRCVGGRVERVLEAALEVAEEAPTFFQNAVQASLVALRQRLFCVALRELSEAEHRIERGAELASQNGDVFSLGAFQFVQLSARCLQGRLIIGSVVKDQHGATIGCGAIAHAYHPPAARACVQIAQRLRALEAARRELAIPPIEHRFEIGRGIEQGSAGALLIARLPSGRKTATASSMASRAMPSASSVPKADDSAHRKATSLTMVSRNMSLSKFGDYPQY